MIFEPPRFVTARKPYTKNVPMIVVDRHLQAWSDYDSTLTPRPLNEILTDCRRPNAKVGRHPTSLLVCTNPNKVLLELHTKFENDPTWNFKISIHDRESYVNGVVKTQKDDAAVSFLGFRDDAKHTFYHYIVSPKRFTRSSLAELVPGSQTELAKLYEWAQALYVFAQENEMKLSGSAGALAAQFLRDPRFYPEDRRKVPTATNERARQALPGNHYELRGETERMYGAAVYFDQENAHHYAARTVELPHSDWLYARGYFHEPKEWCAPGDAEYQYTIENEKGLLYARIWVPKYLDGYLPSWAHQSGGHDAYIFTNELPLLKELGVEIRHLYAAWTSPELDTGLAKYSEYAIQQIKDRPNDKKWLKSVLLSTYGILASKPRRYEFGYLHAKGEPTGFPIGPHEIQIVRTSTKKESQLAIANVIHRGMIEAETRKLSIQLARQLESEGHKVLSIYADGVIMKDDGKQLPLIPAPWRAKDRLRHLVFLNPTSFESDLLSRRPGVPKNIKR